jgi:hypothetical protein
LADTNSGKVAGIWPFLSESCRKRPDLGRSGRRFGQNGRIRLDARGPAVQAGIPARRPDPARLPETRPLRPDSGQSGRNLARYLRNPTMFAGFQPNLLDSCTDWSRNLACRNPTIFNCLNVKVDCVV